MYLVVKFPNQIVQLNLRSHSQHWNAEANAVEAVTWDIPHGGCAELTVVELITHTTPSRRWFFAQSESHAIGKKQR